MIEVMWDNMPWKEEGIDWNQREREREREKMIMLKKDVTKSKSC